MHTNSHTQNKYWHNFVYVMNFLAALPTKRAYGFSDSRNTISIFWRFKMSTLRGMEREKQNRAWDCELFNFDFLVDVLFCASRVKKKILCGKYLKKGRLTSIYNWKFDETSTWSEITCLLCKYNSRLLFSLLSKFTWKILNVYLPN